MRYLLLSLLPAALLYPLTPANAQTLCMPDGLGGFRCTGGSSTTNIRSNMLGGYEVESNTFDSNWHQRRNSRCSISPGPMGSYNTNCY